MASNDLSLRLAQGLRNWEQSNPKTSMALGFVPVVGQAYGAASTAAALRDPEATRLEKGLAAGSMLPFGSMLRRAKGLRNIDTYHGSSTPDLEKTGLRVPSKPEHIAHGAADGPGAYTATNPAPASLHFDPKTGQRYLYETVVDDDALRGYLPSDPDFLRLGRRGMMEELDALDIDPKAIDYLRRLGGGDMPTGVNTHFQNLMGRGEVQSMFNARADALRHGIRGTRRGTNQSGQVFASFDPKDVTVRRRHELVVPHNRQSFPNIGTDFPRANLEEVLRTGRTGDNVLDQLQVLDQLVEMREVGLDEDYAQLMATFLRDIK